MAMLASKASFPPQMPPPPTPSSMMVAPTLSSGSSVTTSTSRGGAPTVSSGQSFPSPSDSEFSEDESPDSVKNWDEDRVCVYLRSVRCGDYEKLFRKNHINGENLLELDKDVLREMGIDKVGDRVRLFLGIKKLRTRAYANQKKRNRDSFGLLDTPAYAPVSHSPRSANGTARANRRYSRQFDHNVTLDGAAMSSSSRPASPLPGSDARGDHRPVPRFGQSPVLPGNAAFSPPESQSSRLVMTHTKNNSSVDGSLMAALPQGQDVIRVISTGGVTKVVKIADCDTCEEVMRVTLRKFALREDHERNYCFWVLAGVDPDPAQCRRLGDTELWRIIRDQKRPERNRLILRRVPAGEPGEPELQRAAAIATEEAQQSSHLHHHHHHHHHLLHRHRHPHPRTAAAGGGLPTAENRSQLKAQKILGERWNSQLQNPLSPLSFQDRERNLNNAARDLERPATRDFSSASASSPSGSRAARKSTMRPFGGLRPPSELITSDLTSYFPDHAREDIDRTARLSMRRSTRLSKVNSRLSVASNLSFVSSIQDAPPIPTIADTWLSATSQLAKVRARESLGGGGGGGGRGHHFRDSVGSSMLDTLQEETASLEPNRKSYVSFTDGPETSISVTDADGNVVSSGSSFYDGDTSTGGSGSVSFEHAKSPALTGDPEDAAAAAADEEVDEELQSFLAGESWDDNQWMKGALIGQGSFGCVYLALHAITGELLAVKQVEMPAPGNGGSQIDNRKKNMIEALKREISLLRDLRHPNIVQYLGCSSSAEYLNIFLEYVAGGSVQTMLNSYGALPEPLVRSFVRQILTGLSYLHNRDIIHRDIKGANILVDNKGTIKISDFGISKKLEATNILNGAGNNRNRPSLQGSVFWMAPEVVKQTSYTRKADIWSLGCLVVEMMTGQHPFPDCSQLQAIFKIGGGKVAPTIPEHASAEAKAFLCQTFEIDHDLRPSADELIMSAFLVPIA